MSNTSLVIYAKTKEYIQALLETEEHTTYKKALSDFKNDKESTKLLSNWQEAQNSYMVLRKGNFSGAEEAEQKFRELNKIFAKNDKIQNLIKSQNRLQSLIDELVGDINQGIDFPFVQPQRGGCCG